MAIQIPEINAIDLAEVIRDQVKRLRGARQDHPLLAGTYDAQLHTLNSIAYKLAQKLYPYDGGYEELRRESFSKACGFPKDRALVDEYWERTKKGDR